MKIAKKYLSGELRVERSTDVKGSGIVVKPRYYLHVIKYGSSPQLWANPQMDIKTAVEQFANASNSMELGGLLGATDAKAAFAQAYDCLQQAVASERFRDSFPLMLFHLTDGESQTDAQPEAQEIMQLSVNDGEVLVVNAYIDTPQAMRDILRRVVQRKRAKSFQTTIIAAHVLKCGDSAFFAFSPEGQLLTSSLAFSTDSQDSKESSDTKHDSSFVPKHIAFGPGDEEIP